MMFPMFLTFCRLMVSVLNSANLTSGTCGVALTIATKLEQNFGFDIIFDKYLRNTSIAESFG